VLDVFAASVDQLVARYQQAQAVGDPAAAPRRLASIAE
jgi:hypothetical protein